jgi:hypothetical protein
VHALMRAAAMPWIAAARACARDGAPGMAASAPRRDAACAFSCRIDS